MSKIFSLMCCMLLAFEAQGSQILQTRDHGKIKAVISNREQNRIALADDRIENIFGSEEMFVFQSDIKLGQIFLRPKDEVKSFTVTLTSEKGQTIDLYLTPEPRDSETVIIKIDNDTAPTSKKPNTKNEVEQLIQAVLRDEPILGYVFHGMLKNAPDANFAALTKEKIYSSHKHLVTIYSYKNLKGRVVTLNQDMFNLSDNVIGVGIRSRKLKPGETTQVVVIER